MESSSSHSASLPTSVLSLIAVVLSILVLRSQLWSLWGIYRLFFAISAVLSVIFALIFAIIFLFSFTFPLRADLPTSPWTSRFVTTWNLVCLLFGWNKDTHMSVLSLYATWQSHLTSDSSTQYINFGYWTEGARTLDEAGLQMAIEMGTRAGMDKGKKVLDVGFGFGDQDILWAKKFGCSIEGLNITESQIEVARKKVEDAGLQDQIDLHYGTATDMKIPDSSVDVVSAVECAFHFDPREDFLAEAHRVLKKGGVVMVGDIFAPENPSFWQKMLYTFLSNIWVVPKSNLYPPSEVKKKLHNLGFESVEIVDISSRVWPHLSRFQTEQIFKKHLDSFHPLVRNRFAIALYIGFYCFAWPLITMPYCFVRATK